jgi:Family of unknown function (DUF6266)
MAKINTPLYNLSGKIGDKVYYNLNGIQVVRKKPAPRKTVPSAKEIEHRSRFAFISRFLLPLKSLIGLSFIPAGMTSFNRAVSVNFKHAVIGSYPDWQIDFSKFKLGEGNTAGPADLLVNTQQDGQLLFSWNGKSGRKGSCSRDRLWVAVYCESLQKWLIKIDIAYRKEGSFNLNPGISGYPLHIYLGFISDFWRGGSDSQYIGILT